MKAICLQCTKEYERTNNKQKYCGSIREKDSCSYKQKLARNFKKKGRILIKKFCVDCNTELQKKNGYFLKYCPECKQKKKVKVEIEKKPSQRKNKSHTCTNCTNEVKSYVSRTGANTYVYPKYCAECFLKKVWIIKQDKKPKTPKPPKDYSHIPTEFVPQEKVKEYIFRPKLSLTPVERRKALHCTRPLKIKSCNYCRCEIRSYDFRDKWCSEWCWELDTFNESKGPSPRCNYSSCDNICYPFYNRNGQITTYAKYCEEHKGYNRKYNKYVFKEFKTG
jgi:hypothetical protein